METFKKVLKLKEVDYFQKHLEIVNSMLPVKMTPKEIEVLSNFISLKGEIAEEDRFGTTCRKIVKSRMNLKDGGLGNFLKSLKTKGFIKEDENGKLKILPFLFANSNTQVYMIKIVKDE